MIWTRKYIEEWLREPVSPLMESILYRLEPEANKVLKDWLGVTWPHPILKNINGFAYVGIDPFLLLKQPRAFLAPIKLFQGLRTVDKEWRKEILPKYKKEMTKLKKFDFKKAPDKGLLAYLEKIMKLEAWIYVNSMYVGVHCVYSERLLRYAYKFLVKDEKWRNYNQLIRGFPNKTVEADQALWELARSIGKSSYKEKLSAFLEEYGHRVFDVDVVHPTLAEDKELLDNLVRIYSKVPPSKSPGRLLEEAKKDRLKQEEFAFKNLREWIPFSRRIFEKILRFSQRYADIRESRPFYHLMAFSLSRKALLELGKRMVQLKEADDIFYLTHQEIEELVKNPKTPKREVEEKVKRRRIVREEQKKNPPVEFINI
jgi:hypothetical protein